MLIGWWWRLLSSRGPASDNNFILYLSCSIDGPKESSRLQSPPAGIGVVGAAVFIFSPILALRSGSSWRLRVLEYGFGGWSGSIDSGVSRIGYGGSSSTDSAS